MVDGHFVVELGMIQDRQHGTAGAGLGICRREYEAIEARMNQGSGTHSAGFEGREDRAVVETVVAEDFCGFAKADDFGVGCGIVVAHDAILATRDDLAVPDQDRADRHFA